MTPEDEHDKDARAARSAKLRTYFARYVTERGSARDPRIREAFASVPREPFAGPAPWSLVGPLAFFLSRFTYVETPDDDPAFLYQDNLIALDASRGINIGDPSFHAYCLQALAVQRGETVMQIGAGSGYYTAILAYLVGPGGRCDAFELDPHLAARAMANLADRDWVTIHARSGVADDLPRVDAVYVNAAATRPARGWLEALKPGGRLLFPLQHRGRLGGMLLIHRPADGGTSWPARFVTRTNFIACEGLQDEEVGTRLAATFEAGPDWMKVRSLRLDGEADDTCWFKGEGWWLSTAPPD